MSSAFTWNSPGPWSNPTYAEPGYEHDLFVDEELFFTACSSVTNLPDGYDDCPTAGVFDPNGPVFSFGSYDATQIQAYEYYQGSWFFSGGGSVSTSYAALMGQETENRCLGWNTIWCRYATRTKELTTGNLNWGGAPNQAFWQTSP
jgi:hypothetical protein